MLLHLVLWRFGNIPAFTRNDFRRCGSHQLGIFLLGRCLVIILYRSFQWGVVIVISVINEVHRGLGRVLRFPCLNPFVERLDGIPPLVLDPEDAHGRSGKLVLKR